MLQLRLCRCRLRSGDGTSRFRVTLLGVQELAMTWRSRRARLSIVGQRVTMKLDPPGASKPGLGGRDALPVPERWGHWGVTCPCSGGWHLCVHSHKFIGLQRGQGKCSLNKQANKCTCGRGLHYTVYFEGLLLGDCDGGKGGWPLTRMNGLMIR